MRISSAAMRVTPLLAVNDTGAQRLDAMVENGILLGNVVTSTRLAAHEKR